MSYYTIALKAGIEHVQDVIGSLILVDGIDGAAGVDVTPVLNGSRQPKMPGRKAGFKYQVKYESVILAADADCTVSIFLTNNDVTLGFTDGAQVNVLGSVSISNGADQRVPVDLANGTVNVTATNVGINNDTAHPVPVQRAGFASLVHSDPVNVPTAAPQAIVADATLKRLLFRNESADAVIALGGATMTFANAVIKLNPGDIWDEGDAAGATWYAVADKDDAQVHTMGMK